MKVNDIKSKIADLNKEQAATEQLVKDLPEDFPEPDSLCWHHSSLCEYSMTYHFKDLDEARAMVDRFAGYILPLFLYRGTFTGFRTPEHEREQGATETPVMPIKVDVDQHGLEFEFYTLVNGHLLSIGIKLDNGWQRLARPLFRTWHGRYVAKDGTSLFADGFQGYKHIKWAAGSREYPNSFTLYWPEGYQFDDIFTESK